MSTETPETPVAATPPTPESVAEMLTSGDNDYHDGNYWHPSIGADGNVVHIGITAYSEDGDKLPEVRFRAVVVEGEVTPIVLDRETYRDDVEEIVKAFSTALAASAREDYPYHLARLKGALWDLAEAEAEAGGAQ
ncbi:hypothetical protein [Nonomuraea sp. NPDC050202]|uniref:hypothetical protein n=1 Tax=Nonomuraea sp. NPDC050202 TaxID=3155035 RepID=UPI003406C875